MTTYTFRIDETARDVLLSSLKLVLNAAEQPLVSGEFSDESLQNYEGVSQLYKGILFVKPDAEPEVEEPVVGPEAGINQSAIRDEADLDTPSH